MALELKEGGGNGFVYPLRFVPESFESSYSGSEDLRGGIFFGGIGGGEDISMDFRLLFDFGRHILLETASKDRDGVQGLGLISNQRGQVSGPYHILRIFWENNFCQHAASVLYPQYNVVLTFPSSRISLFHNYTLFPDDTIIFTSSEASTGFPSTQSTDANGSDCAPSVSAIAGSSVKFLKL